MKIKNLDRRVIGIKEREWKQEIGEETLEASED